MAARWGRWPNPVLRPLLDSLWLPSGDPVSDSFLVRLGGGFGTHCGAHLERLKYPVKESCTRKLRSFSQPGKLPLHASQVCVGKSGGDTKNRIMMMVRRSLLKEPKAQLDFLKNAGCQALLKGKETASAAAATSRCLGVWVARESVGGNPI